MLIHSISISIVSHDVSKDFLKYMKEVNKRSLTKRNKQAHQREEQHQCVEFTP